MPSYDGEPDMAPQSAGRDAAHKDLAYLIDIGAPEDRFRADVLNGLSEPQPFIPPKYFYDAFGAEAFERICETPEYYPTRSESALLHAAAPDIAALAGPHANLYEPGSGAAEKARILLTAFDRPAEYTLFDIAEDQLRYVAASLNQDFPSLRIGAVIGDFTRTLEPTADMFAGDGKRVCFFPGSTLGNFDPEAALGLLKTFKSVLRPGDALLLGVDLAKDSARLDAAYNDAQGWTAAFNLNLLHRLKNDLGAKIRISDFDHYAFFSPRDSRIEMHLTARRATSIELDERVFNFARGQTIHTENSWKFTPKRLADLVAAAGYELTQSWGGSDAPTTDKTQRSDMLLAWCEVQ